MSSSVRKSLRKGLRVSAAIDPWKIKPRVGKRRKEKAGTVSRDKTFLALQAAVNRGQEELEQLLQSTNTSVRPTYPPQRNNKAARLETGCPRS